MARKSAIGAERGLTRFEAFTDGVFAIALTLLIVELPSPGSFDGPPEPAGLMRALAEEWRAYLALGVSWWVIGVFWLQHHYTGRIYSRTDHVFSLLNLIFLLGVNLTPFAIRIWAEHLDQPEDARTAMTLLACVLALPSAGWMGKWLYAQRRELTDQRLDPAFLRRMTRQHAASTGAMLAAAALSVVAPAWGLGLAMAVTFAYAWPPRRPLFQDGDPGDLDVEDAAGSEIDAAREDAASASQASAP